MIGVRMNLKEYLILYPWDKKLLTKEKPVHYFFTIHLNVSIKELWPYLSDTSLINERLKLPRMIFDEKEGILYGRSKLAGVHQEWEEVPWEWEYGKSIRNERIYSKGLLLRGIAHFLLEEKENETLYHVYFGFLPKAVSARLLLLSAKKIFINKYINVFRGIEKEIHKKSSSVIIKPGIISNHISKIESPADNNKINIIKIRDISHQIKKTDIVNPEILDKFIEYICNADDSFLYRMRPVRLAEVLDVNRTDLLLVMLHATKKGLINMSWDIICPHCQGIRERAEHLWDVNKHASCEVCQIDFDTSSVNSLEISFYINPYIKK